MINRRTVVRMIGGAGTAFALTPLNGALHTAHAATQEERILRRAKQLAGPHPDGLTVLLPRGSEANVKPVADAFSAAVGVPIRFSFTGVDEVNTRILTDTLVGSNSFDVALPATFGLPDLVEANALAALDEFEEKYRPDIDATPSLYPTGDSFLGKTYGFQTDGDVYVMFYRKSWLEDPDARRRFESRYGEPLRIPETWDELDRLISFFHRPDENLFGGALFRSPIYLVWEWWIRLHSNGSWPVDDAFRPLINSEAGIAALESIITSTANLYPNALTNGLVDNWEAFAEGNMFCNIGWGGSQKFFNREGSKIRGDLIYGTTPGIRRGGRVTPVS